MAVDLPAVVIEAEAPNKARPLSTLRPTELRALASFTEASGLRAIELPEAKAKLAVAIDKDRSARIMRVEEALHRARDPLDLADREQIPTVRTTIALAYDEARAHPEDPEAPFLVAEALRTLARVEELAGDPVSARALRARADLLDGGRRIGLSEGGSNEATVPATVSVAIAIDAGAELFVDGSRHEGPLSLAPGEHHVRVVRDGATLVAKWMAIGAAPTQTLSLTTAAPIVACSAIDLEPALASASFSIACARWLRVRRTSTALAIQVCGATSCGPASTYSTTPLPKPIPEQPHETSLLGSKWTWIGVGAAIVIGGTITAWQLGAFDGTDAPPRTWRWEGVK